MGRHRSLILTLAVACAGCNQVFGIEPTREIDSDLDGYSNSDDNCALIANPEQANGDGDALGDACDPCDGPQSGLDLDRDGIDDACDACPDGSNHDEDGDGFLDGCDACPGIADDGTDGDDDGVGDACDAAPGVANRRVFFDGFGPARDDWRHWFQPWEGVGDSFAPVNGGGLGAWNLASQVSGTGWWMEVAVVKPPDVDGDRYGFDMREVPGANLTQGCFLELDTGAWRPNYYFGESFVPGEVTLFRLRSISATEYECTIDGQTVLPLDYTPTSTSAYVVTLLAIYGTSFLWVDVVAGP